MTTANVTDGPPIRVGYLAGINYCGSTLVSFVLNAHPQVLSIGEAGPRYVANRKSYLCSCGVDTTECEFYTSVRSRMADRGVPFDVVNMFLQPRYSPSMLIERVLRRPLPWPLDWARNTLRDNLPPFRGRLRQAEIRNEAFMRAALEIVDKPVFLDGTKSAHRIPFLQRLNLDLKVVHLVRDPRGYAYSANRHVERTMEEAARNWVRGHTGVEREMRRVPAGRSYRVRYEDICREPVKHLSQLTEFLGAGPFEMPEHLDAHDHHVIGNKGRLSNRRREAIRFEEKWRDALTPQQQATVAAIAGPTARRYGYEI